LRDSAGAYLYPTSANFAAAFLGL